MNKYIVISYDPDEQQTFWDRVLAPGKDRAQTIVADLRYYAIIVDVVDAATLLEVGTALANATPPEVRAAWRQLVTEQGGVQR